MKPLLFHHCTDLQALLENEILQPHPDLSDEHFRKAYLLWEKLFGFYPLFLAVGTGEKTFSTTGYPNQFSRITCIRFDKEKGKRVAEHKPKGEFDNYAMLSFKEVEGIAHKYETWVDVLCWSCNSGKAPKRYLDRLLKQSQRPLSSWMESARRKDGYVQLCAKSLDPKKASRIWVRNLKAKKALETRGFQNVSVVRLPSPKWWT